MKDKVYVGLGSNVGNPRDNLFKALQLLSEHPQIDVVKVAGLYLTEPIGFLDQPWFHNTVVELDTSLTPQDLLKTLQAIEQMLGRVRDVRWGPRTIDLDIILYQDGRLIDEENLVVPHPRIRERAFVLRPLAELGPDLQVDNYTVIEWMEKIKDQKVLFTDMKIW